MDKEQLAKPKGRGTLGTEEQMSETERQEVRHKVQKILEVAQKKMKETLIKVELPQRFTKRVTW